MLKTNNRARNLLLGALSLLASVSATATTATLAPLPSPVCLDTEVTANCAMTAWNDLTRTFNLTLAFDATPSNNVQIAFGHDADGNGILSAGETGAKIGWDCGAWFMDDVQSDSRFTETNVVATTRKTLTFEMRLSDDGTPRNLSVRDGAPRIFTSLTGHPPVWLYNPSWNLMRLTARGLDDPNEQFRIRIAADGFHIIIR